MCCVLCIVYQTNSSVLPKLPFLPKNALPVLCLGTLGPKEKTYCLLLFSVCSILDRISLDKRLNLCGLQVPIFVGINCIKNEVCWCFAETKPFAFLFKLIFGEVIAMMIVLVLNGAQSLLCVIPIEIVSPHSKS